MTFSIVIYQVASNEVGIRLERLQSTLQRSNRLNQSPTQLIVSEIRADELDKAASNLSIELLYINLIMLFVGGFGSYYFARRSLLPIEKAHDAQSRFTSDASHELRTPLAVMKTELEVALRDDTATKESLKQVLSSNLEEVDKLTKLSQMLLSLSQLDSVTLKLCSVNLTKITHDAIKNFNQPKNRIKLTSKGQQMVCGNETALADLVKVLIDNALQYSPKKSSILINVSKQDQSIKFEITNSGTGISPDKLPFIFDRFYRADLSRTDGSHNGYGLGLALAKNITELHNGSLTASSILNGDTTFKLILPQYSKDLIKSN
jgi:signal transduction histidine kinase